MTEDTRPEAVTDDQRKELADTLRSLLPVLGKFLSVLARVLFRVSLVALGWLLTGFRQLLFGSLREELSHWVYLKGDRRLIVGAFVGTVFVGTLSLGMAGVIGIRQSSFITTMFSTIIAGLFSFIPIVIGVNQLTLSWLSGTPDRLRDRLDSVEGLRREADELSAEIEANSTEPVAFTKGLLRSVADSTEAVAEASERARAEEVLEHATTIHEQVVDTEEALVENDDLFGLLYPMLSDDYAHLAARTRQLQREQADEAVRDALDHLDEALVTLDVTRKYFKTLYVQRSLARLSRQLAYTGTAALMLSTLIVMIYASGYPPVVHESPLLVLVSVSLAGAFAPFAALFACVVQLSTVIQRTVSSGLFTPTNRNSL